MRFAAMAYEEELADELRERLEPVAGELIEKRMFGGLAFMVEGHLTIAASRNGGLLVRTDPDEAEEVLAQPGAEPMEMRGRPMRGWVFVDGRARDRRRPRRLDRARPCLRHLAPA